MAEKEESCPKTTDFEERTKGGDGNEFEYIQIGFKYLTTSSPSSEREEIPDDVGQESEFVS